MSCEVPILIKDLSKCYQIYDRPHHRLLQMIHRGHRQYYHEFWALKNLSMNVERGETVGIIGRNGAGKSTLLKMICGTLNPTKGTIKTNGRIAAILELGTGFNPEFTGRENVYLKASILGLKNKEIDDRFGSIADFAEIGDFIDQPVRTYSSGMLVRLAFAVSVNVDPEILIVDEALSVGDERFQRKCFSRIESIRNSGATILFVSHSGSTVIQLCDRAILLEDGAKLAEGMPKKIYGYYQKLLYAPDDKKDFVKLSIVADEPLPAAIESDQKVAEVNTQAPDRQQQDAENFNPDLVPTSTIEYESCGAVIYNPQILTLSGKIVNNLVRSKRYIYNYAVDFTEDVQNVRFGMLIKTKTGVELGGATSACSLHEMVEFIPAGTKYSVQFNFRCALNEGTYFLNAGVIGEISGVETVLHRLLDLAMFKVQPEPKRLTTAIIDFDCKPDFSILKN